MEKILIQANNLDTVIDTLMYIYYHQGCSKQELADYCGFTLRQANYYTSACKYLDLIDDNQNITPSALDIFVHNPTEVSERVYERIITDEVMGQVFAKLYLFPSEDHLPFAIELSKKYFLGYSETVYTRRAKNIIFWCQRIIEKTNLKKQ